ncbi:hypothetical protein PACTADRAFT_31980 [Pachysolen tannophilus NRRL Y-2460]|uniref:Uncharacterized protein n=1 Tax=Pachysolen tannophilus NRRL Y-2460 TaxID=669874 RepID=A0A1E4U3L0_PACTA|nr:hypothetical protein PACTADRAFT_31980 [Pachysolen tannophilus NRRL Y-2460]
MNQDSTVPPETSSFMFATKDTKEKILSIKQYSTKTHIGKKNKQFLSMSLENDDNGVELDFAQKDGLLLCIPKTANSEEIEKQQDTHYAKRHFIPLFKQKLETTIEKMIFPLEDSNHFNYIDKDAHYNQIQ